MSKASEIYNTLINDITVLGPISYLDLKKGDLVARIDKGVTAMFTFESRAGDRASVKGGGQLFLTGNGVKLYLVDRPKPPLPTGEGARIVAWKISGKEYPEGLVLVHDGDEDRNYPWDGPLDCHSGDDIEVWSVLPEDAFAHYDKVAA